MSGLGLGQLAAHGFAKLTGAQRAAGSIQWHKVSAGAAWVVLPVVGSTVCRLSKVVME